MKHQKHHSGNRYLLGLLSGFALLTVVLALCLKNSTPSLDLSRSPLVTQAAYQDGPKVDLEGGIAWINTGGPIRIDDLKGKIVLLDFWTFCCINCHHVLPDLERLEKKYPNELVVIGVHSAKFQAEKDTANVRRKVAEYRIKHPVINDANMTLWQKFGVNSWPTFVLVDANGRYRGFTSGEGKYELLDEVISKLIAEHKAKNELNTTPIKFLPESEKSYDQPLLYPGKVHTNGPANRLFVTDTGHNRIVVSDLDGNVLDVIGNGQTGFKDGGFQEATFNRPQGTYFKDNFLFIADTENHAIRVADMTKKTVKTLAGTGVQSYRREGYGKASETGLNSPWDIAPLPEGNRFAIAMAGPHQIWELDLDKERVGVLVGSGREDIIDGKFPQSALAQPSGLASDGENIFFADSETSSLRLMLMKTKQVETLVGKGLFDFGDIVGPATRARFQHCLGVAYHNGIVFVADSYNNKIKLYDVKKKAVANLFGSGEPGSDNDGPNSKFYQPGGVSYVNNKLYIADTNNGLVRVADLATNEVKTLELKGLTKPEIEIKPPAFLNAELIKLMAAKVAPEKMLSLDVKVPVSGVLKLNPLAPIRYVVEIKDADGKVIGGTKPGGETLDAAKDSFSMSVNLKDALEAGKSLSMKVSVATMQCKDGAEGFCVDKSYVWEVPLAVDAAGSNRVSLGAAK